MNVKDDPYLSILREVFRFQPMTRQILSANTLLSASRVRSRVASLVAAGLLAEEPGQVTARGRPPGLLSLNPDIGLVVGLDIDGAKSYAVLSDVHGRVIGSAATATETVSDRDTILGNITGLVREVCERGSVTPSSLAAVGVGVGAIVNTNTGLVLDWPNTPAWAEAWKGMSLPHELGDRLGVELIVVDDSVRCMGVASHRFGIARGVTDFLYLFLGTGIGSCVFVGGRPYPGSKGIAGELGHVVIDEDGLWCSCGSRGCLETLASTRAVLRQVSERLDQPHVMSALRDPYERDALSLDTLVEAARAGDKLAFQILVEAGNNIGKVVAIALNILGPEMVILGGPLAKDDDIILNAVCHQARLRALQHVSEEVRIVYDDGDELVGARGAAVQAWEALFESAESLARLVECVAAKNTPA